MAIIYIIIWLTYKYYYTPISPLQIDPSHHYTEETVFPCRAYGKRLTVLQELETHLIKSDW